ncbi:type VI secretion system baseplate subunit TssF, partial [Pseudomonas sp. CCC2.2]|nr:type VI secretion system baseplate subunit TssF [Pseudomonas sp. CCC2.2]
MTCDGLVGELDLCRLRLLFGGDRYISLTLHLSLLRHLDSIEVIPLDAKLEHMKGVDLGNSLSFLLPSENVQP